MIQHTLSSTALHTKTGRRVVALDARNHGESPHTAVMDYPHMAADIAAAADRLGLGRVTLVGHSMGGRASMQLALMDSQERAIPIV